MNLTNYAKLQDRLRAGITSGRNEPADLTPLLGTWINTNVATAGITKAVVTSDQSELSLRVFGAGEPEPWDAVKVKAVFADSIGSENVISFTAEYDFDFLETEIQANLAKGLLIITSLNTFKDGSSRSDYFSREYFFRKPTD